MSVEKLLDYSKVWLGNCIRTTHCFFLFFGLFKMATGKAVNATYRFEVNPVDKCPRNETEFESAAKRMNCTGKSRYLCAPNRDLTNLIEFCTDRPINLFNQGNCLRLEGTGDLNHYSCTEFDTGCPDEPYTDEEIYKYPACLNIDTISHCFVAECPSRVIPAVNKSQNEGSGNESRTENHGGFIAAVVTIFILLNLALIAAVIYSRRRKRKTLKEDLRRDELRKFLQNENVVVDHARCFIFGCGGAGKTTRLKRLEGASFKEVKDLQITESVDVHVNQFEVLENENTIKHIKGSKDENSLTIPFSVDGIQNKNTAAAPDTPGENTEDGFKNYDSECRGNRA